MASRIVAARRPEDRTRPSDLKDALIAAAALVYGMVVVIVNVNDFSHIQKNFPALRVLPLSGVGVEARAGAMFLDRLSALYRTAPRPS